MLILTRRPAETIYIGEQVTVTVLGVVGNQVRFGIEAPRSITIDRAEIHERKKRAAQGGNANGNVAPDTCEEEEVTASARPHTRVERAPAHSRPEVNGNLAEDAERPDLAPTPDPASSPDQVIEVVATRERKAPLGLKIRR